MDPLVSAQWLRYNQWRHNLVILDIRGDAAYDAGHIRGSIVSTPFFNWSINAPFGPDAPWMELPPVEDLFETLGNHGITKNTWVVVVGTSSGPTIPGVGPIGLFNNADPTRVAMTLIYAGVKEVAILNGAIEAWIDAGYPLTTDIPVITPVTYDGQVKASMMVDTAYVESKIGKATIVDARDLIVYNGGMTEPWAPLAFGHIPTARSLPTPDLWNVVWNEAGDFVISASYKDKAELRDLARDVVGSRWYYRWCRKQIIVYCGVGGYASTVFFVLSEVLGYSNVKVYDGSMQAWAAEGLPTVT